MKRENARLPLIFIIVRFDEKVNCFFVESSQPTVAGFHESEIFWKRRSRLWDQSKFPIEKASNLRISPIASRSRISAVEKP